MVREGEKTHPPALQQPVSERRPSVLTQPTQTPSTKFDFVEERSQGAKPLPGLNFEGPSKPLSGSTPTFILILASTPLMSLRAASTEVSYAKGSMVIYGAFCTTSSTTDLAPPMFTKSNRTSKIKAPQS